MKNLPYKYYIPLCISLGCSIVSLNAQASMFEESFSDNGTHTDIGIRNIHLDNLYDTKNNMASFSQGSSKITPASGKLEMAAWDLEKLKTQDETVTSLILSGTIGKNAEKIKFFPNLKEIDLSDLTDLYDSYSSSLAALKHLTSANLSNRSIRDESLKHLSNLNNLKVLDISKTHVFGGGLVSLSTLTSLESLNIANTLAGNKAIQSLAACINLKQLNTQGSQVTEEGITQLQSAIIKNQQEQGLNESRFQWSH